MLLLERNPSLYLSAKLTKTPAALHILRCITAALMLSRSGRLNIATFATGKLIPLSDKKLDAANWKHCSLGFSKNGLLGLALDRSGKLLGVKISALQKQP